MTEAMRHGNQRKASVPIRRRKVERGRNWRPGEYRGQRVRGPCKIDGDKIIPIIRGTAHITGELELILDENDPFRFGIN
jgi:4-hydroxyproline epimerase